MLKTDDETAVEHEPLDTRIPPHIRVLNGSLDEDPNSPNAVVLSGRIDINSLRFLKADTEYQRPLGDRADIWNALKAGTVVPNIEIGVRGQDFEFKGDDCIIRSPAYIIDGWQRVGTALRLLEEVPNHPMRMFGTFHFGTDSIWERHRFTELNKNIRKVSPNLHLRNMRDSNEAVLTLFGLSKNAKDFPLFRKVCWSQNMARGDLVSARELARVAMRLHGHVTKMKSSRTEALAESINVAAQEVSLTKFRKNMMTYFELLDACWPLNMIEYRRSAPQIKSAFMFELARMFSLHTDFWDQPGKTFGVAANDRLKLSKFPIDDPHVKNLVGSPGAARQILYDLLIKHMNSGRRTHRLSARYQF